MGALQTLLWFVQFLILVRLSQSQNPQVGVTYCSEIGPLDTEYITPFYEYHVPVFSCASQEVANDPQGFKVHVFRINTTAEDVVLQYHEQGPSSAGLIFILDSLTPVGWRIAFLGDTSFNSQKRIYVSKGSSILSNNQKSTSSVEILSLLETSSDLKDASYIDFVRKQFGGVSTFANVKGANRISTFLPKVERLSSTCDIDQPTDAEDNSILAYHTVKQAMSGCFKPEIAGVSKSDVYVVDLVAAEKEINMLDIPIDNDDLNIDAPHLPAVYVSLLPDVRSLNVKEDGFRNLTLFLKSQMPVRWYLESWGLTGLLEVISNNGPVENHSLSSSQNLNITRKTLPSDFDQLLKSVVHETGTVPVSYIKVKIANVLSLIISPRSKRGLVNPFNSKDGLVDEPEQQFETEPTRRASAPDDFRLDTIARKHEIQAVLAKAMSRECTNNQFIIVSFPRNVTNLNNVTGMRFPEATCRATANKTHWVLKAHSTSCGFINYFSNQNPIVETNVFIEFSPSSDLYNQEVTIPIVCKFPTGIFGLSDDGDSDYDDNLQRIDDSYDEEDSSDDSFQTNFYGMQVFRTSPSPLTLLSEKVGTPATVSVGDRLKVVTSFETKWDLSLTIEKCWISDKSNAKPGQDLDKIDDNRLLILDGCPHGGNISMGQTDNFPTFSFVISQKYLRINKFYLACQIGLCSPMENPQENIQMCFDPSTCSKTSKKPDSSSAQQIIKRGPIFVIDNPTLTEIPVYIGSNNSWRQRLAAPVVSESPSLHSSHVVMVGVSAEIAVVIAVASFGIGALLTGMLCWIHHRRAIPKNGFNPRSSDRIDRTDGSELQSMIASPSIQVHQLNGTIT